MLSKLKKVNLVSVILLILPIIDVISTVTGKRLSLITRGIFLLGMLFYFLLFGKSKIKRNSIVLLFILGVFFFFYLLHYFSLNKFFNITNEFITLIKFLYLPIITILLINYFYDKKINIRSLLVKIAIIYCVLTIVPTILGIALKSYNYGKLGYSGLFYSPNELSSILAILSPFVIFNNFKSDKKIFSFIFTIIFIIACYVLGTKTPIMSLILTLITSLVILIIRFFITKEKNKNIILVVLFLLFTVLIYNKSYLYYNMNLQYNSFYGSDQITNTTNASQIKESISLYDKYINFPKITINQKYYKSKILNLIFSSRDLYLQKGFDKYKSATFNKKMLGMTLGPTENDIHNSNMTEMDFFDILFYYGVIGSIILCGYLLVALIWGLIKILKNFKKNILDDDLCVTYLSYAISILIAIIAGHLLSAPTATIFIALILVNLYFKLFKKDHFENLKISKFLVIMGIALIVIEIPLLVYDFYSKRFNLIIRLNDSGISFNQEMNLINTEEFIYKDIKEELYYYESENYKKFKIIHVRRTYSDNEKIDFFTITNDDSITANVNIQNSGENTVISNAYHYTLAYTDIVSFNKNVVKNLVNESKNCKDDDKEIIMQERVPKNTSIDFYLITTDESLKISSNELPWMSFNATYNNIYDSFYIKDIENVNFDYSSETLKNIMTLNYLINLEFYNNHANNVWYKDYYLTNQENNKIDGIYRDASFNYNIYAKLEEIEGVKYYDNFTEDIIKEYEDEKYIKLNKGIIFNNLVNPTFKNQVAITNILLKSKNVKAKKIINELLTELNANKWIKADGGIYNYIALDGTYQGTLNDDNIIYDLMNLVDNLKENYKSTKNIKKYIREIYDNSKFLSEKQKELLKDGGYVE